jgi:hypothetical protein
MIKAEEYGHLAETSIATRKESGPFISCFISGQERDEQQLHKLHSIWPGMFDSRDVDEKYVFRNEDEVSFIVLFIHKYRAAYTKLGDRDKLTYFSADPDSDPNYPPEARCYYVIAGAAVNSAGKPILDKTDPERAALIFFKCNGLKVGPVIEFLNQISERAKELDNLSDGTDAFEESVITPRRFITKVTRNSVDSDYGKKSVFGFSLDKKLPDKSVESIVQKASKWQDPFKLQFDLSGNVDGGSGGHSRQTSVDDDAPTFEDNSTDVVDSVVDELDVELDLGL